MQKFKEFYLKNKLLINCIILSVLFFVHCFWNGMMWIIYPLLIILVLVGNIENGCSYLIYTIPFCYIGRGISLMLFMIAIFVFLTRFYILVIVKEKTKIKKRLFIPLAIFLVYCLLPLGKYNINYWYKLVFLLFIIVTLWVFVNRHEIINIRKNNRIFACAICVSALFGLTYFISPFLQTSLEVIYIKNNLIRFQALMGHTNIFGVMCEVCIAISAYNLIKNRKWYDAVLLILVALLGLLTFSKTYLSLLAFITLAVVIWLFKIDWKKGVLFFLIVLSAIGLFVLFRPDVFSIFHSRFFGPIQECQNLTDILNMITTGRFGLWMEYLLYLSQHPIRFLFGSGLGAPALGDMSAHNAYISMIYQLGVVGTALFVYLIIAVIKTNSNKTRNRNPAIWIPVITILLIFCIEDIMFYII